MRRRGVVVIVAGAAVLGTGCAQAAAARAAGSWGRAITMPGLGALNKGGNADVSSVSCASPGNCSAGGYYTDGGGHQQGFVVSEQNGRWGRAIEVPGLGALNKGRNAQVLSVSCASPGNCAAGGYYGNRSRFLNAGYGRGFVVSERNGGWGKAIEVPGLAALGGSGAVTSVSCGAAGNCAAAGFYASGLQGFVAVERNGVWGKAIEVPGLAALNKYGQAQVWSVSCASAGSCAAGGSYEDSSGFHGFVAVERHGRWDKAIEVPGLAALNKGEYAVVWSVSCGSAGSCAAGGSYWDRHDHYQGFVADERNGVWGKAIEVPGLAALNKGGNAEVTSVSCGSAGNCAAGGSYWLDRPRRYQGFVAVERHGRWRKAITVPGLGALNTGANAGVTSVSCGSAGNCAAGGSYWDRHDHYQGFVAVERHGRWGKAIKVPGLAALNKGDAGVGSVSCPPAGGCAAGGSYTDRRHHAQGFVLNQTG